MSRISSLLFLLLVLLAPATAMADAASNALNEGKRLMGKGQHAQACAQFAKAEAIAGQNVKTRYWTGRCNEEQGNKAAAYLAYRDAKRMAIKAGDTKRTDVINTRIAELGQVLPFLQVTVPESMQGIDGLTIQRNGQDFPRERWGQPMPIETGKHKITVSAPGYQTISLNVTATGPGSTAQLVIPALQPAQGGAAPPPPGPGPTPMPLPGGPVGDQPEMERKNAGLFWTGVGLVSAGGLAVLVGGAALLVSAAEESASFDDFEDSNDTGAAGVGLLVTGGVFLAVGIPFMVVFGKKVPAEKPTAGTVTISPMLSPTGLGLQGTF